MKGMKVGVTELKKFEKKSGYFVYRDGKSYWGGNVYRGINGKLEQGIEITAGQHTDKTLDKVELFKTLSEEIGKGSKYFYFNGEYHREDGPAIELANGEKHWYLNGKEYATEKELIEEVKVRKNM